MDHLIIQYVFLNYRFPVDIEKRGMSSAAAQYRNEKRRMDEAVARVREVVHSASKNDIILALHNFDLDVNRTIQAFCDGKFRLFIALRQYLSIYLDFLSTFPSI